MHNLEGDDNAGAGAGRTLFTEFRLFLRAYVRCKSGYGDKVTATGRCFNSLMSHSKKIKANPILMKNLGSHMDMIRVYLPEDGKISPPTLEEGLKVYGRLCINSTNIADYAADTVCEIGSGLYLSHSQFDHSCRPNAVVTNRGKVLVVRCISRDPLQLEDVRINYLGEKALQPTSTRKKQLRDTYYFNCECLMCNDVQLDSEKLCALCPKPGCGGMVPANAPCCKKCKYLVSPECFWREETSRQTQVKALLSEFHLEMALTLLPTLHTLNTQVIELMLRISSEILEEDDDRAENDRNEIACAVTKTIADSYQHYLPQFDPFLGYFLMVASQAAASLNRDKDSDKLMEAGRMAFGIGYGPDHPALAVLEED